MVVFTYAMASLYDSPSPYSAMSFGYGEAKSWGLQLAEDVKDWKNGQIGWEDVDQGVLLQGPPGVGKTMFASALANSCGIPLVLGSAARWQAEGHLGDMLKAMRRFFQTAAMKAPCIAFIDEVDSFGDRDAVADSQNLDYKRQVVNALLECLAPADGRVGIVVVGATNKVESIDKALLRPGRFEEVIGIPLPDAEARLAIFRHHIPAAAGAFDGTRLATLTRGWSGARIEKLARDARRHSRRQGRAEVSDEDIRSAMPGFRPFTPEERLRLAVHEAGHTLLAFAFEPESFLGVRIEVGIYEGNDVPDLGRTQFRSRNRIFDTGKNLADDIAIRLGGLISEKIILGDHSTTVGGTSFSDLAVATRYATQMEVGFGFGETLTSVADLDEGSLQRYRMYDRALATSVSDRLRSCYERAQVLLEANKDRLVMLAERLAERVELDAAEVGEIIGRIQFPQDSGQDRGEGESLVRKALR
jgi:cell division protease FtsH